MKKSQVAFHKIKPIWYFLNVIFIGYIALSSGLFAAAGGPPATTTDASLVKIATAARGIGALQNDPQSRMFNYLTKHFSAAASRLSTVCDMTTLIYSGVASDSGAIIGMANNTQTTFMVMQDNSIIGEVLPGWNGDIVLNLSVLSDTTTSPLKSFTFVPTTGYQESQLLVRVMTGQQLFTHIQNTQKRESAATAVTWYKNGTNPLPGAGEMAAVSSNLYLVVENATLTTGTPLPGAAKRIQVLNLSNIANLYTVSLSINNMGLAQVNNQVSTQAELQPVYAISIQGVHVLDEVPGHTKPLLLMPRAVYQSGSEVNSLYAAYIQSYANTIGKTYAGTAPVYYDLWIAYPHEPFAYLQALKYLDLDKSRSAVVDQNAAIQSGQVIGSLMLTDVYGAYVQDVSPDISWVACNQSGLDTTDYEHVLFSIVSPTALKIKKPTISAVPTNVKPGQFPLPGQYKAMGGIFMNLRNALQARMQGQLQQQAAISKPDQQSPAAYAGFPMTNISAALMEFNGYYHGHVQTASSLHWSGPILDWYHSYLYDGNPTQYTAGESYNTTGSFPSSWYNLTRAQWKAGIKIVPVFYDVQKCTPYTSMQDFNLINSNNMAALYFYTFDGITGELLGLAPAYNGGNSKVPATFPVATNYIYITRNGTFNSNTKQAADYNNYGEARPGQAGLVGVSQCNIEFPGYAYFAKHPQSNNVMPIRNKLQSIDKVNEIVSSTWSTQNALAGSWLVSAPIADAQAGIMVKVVSMGSNVYQITLFDANNNVLGFQQITAPEKATQLIAGHISTAGAMKGFTRAMPLTASENYFKLMDTPQSGIVMIPIASPVVKSSATKTTSTPTQTVTSVVTSTSTKTGAMNDAQLRTTNQELEKENKELRKEVKNLKAALSAQG